MGLLEVRRLKAVARGREILHGVDFTVREGEAVVLLGANGAGKSTVAKRIMGILGGEGEIVLHGEKMNEKSVDERARAGIFMSHQAPIEIPGVSFKEMLWTALEGREGKIRRTEVEARLREATEILGAEMFLPGKEVNVGASGGERKGNEILQMMVLEPKVAILDEIDSGLDVDMARKMSKALRDFQEKTGVSYVIITHNMRILEALTIGKVIVLEQGRIVREGGAEVVEEVRERGFSK